MRAFKIVEPARVEPATKQGIHTLSTCLFLDYLSGISRIKTNQPFPYLLKTSMRFQRKTAPISNFTMPCRGRLEKTSPVDNWGLPYRISGQNPYRD